MRLSSEEKDNLREAARAIMKDTFVDDDGNPVDTTEAVIEIIDGEAAAPSLWIMRAWISPQAHTEHHDEPNFQLAGNPPGI